MENNIFEILKLLSSFNQNPQNKEQQNTVLTQSYPKEAFQTSQVPQDGNNFLSIILSLLSKGNGLPLGEILNAKNKETQNSKNFEPPNDEILL